MPKETALFIAEKVWKEINLVNLKENILPTRHRAHCVLTKGADHSIKEIRVRRF